MVSSFSFMSKQISGTFPWASSSIESYPSGNKHRVYKAIQLCWTVCMHCVSSRCCGTPFCVPVCVLESSVCSYWAEGRRSQKIRSLSPPQVPIQIIPFSNQNLKTHIKSLFSEKGQQSMVSEKPSNSEICPFANHDFLLSTHPHSDAWTPVTDLWLLSFVGQCHHVIQGFYMIFQSWSWYQHLIYWHWALYILS